MDAVHAHVPKPHDPFVDLVPAPPSIGIKLTPKHYAYLKISEGCNHRCTFCIIPSLRGDLVSRPIGDVLGRGVGAVRVGRQGAARHQPGHQRLRRRRPLSHRLLGRPAGQDAAALAVRAAGRDRGAPRRLGAAALRLSVPARRRRPAADGDGSDPSLPRRAVPAFAPRRAAPDEAAGERREEPRAAGALARDLPAARRPQHLHRRLPRRDRGRVRAPARLHARSAHRSRRLLRLFARRRRERERAARHAAAGGSRGAARSLHARRRGRRDRQAAGARRRDDAGPRRLGAALGRKGGWGRSYADAPEIDGRVRLLPPDKASKTLKAGEFTRARIVAADGHDLVAMPI